MNKINLGLFTISFMLLTFNSFSILRSLSLHDHVPQHVSSKQDAGNDGTAQQLSEKNETENESDFELQSFTLPFSVSYFTVEIRQPSIPSAEPLSEKTPAPIYVAVGNFRI